MAHRQALALVASVVALVGLLSVQPADAARVQMSKFPPNPGVLPGGGWKFTPGSTFGDPPPPRMWVDGVYGAVRSIVATDAITLAGRAGALTVQAAQRMTLAEAAAVVARCLGNPVCMAAASAAAVIITELYSKYRVRPAADGGLEHDEGQPQNETAGYSCQFDGYYGYSTDAVQSCVAAAQLYAAKSGRTTSPDWQGCVVSYTFSVAPPEARGVPILQSTSYGGPNAQCWASGSTTVIGWATNAAATQIKMCPAVFDFESPEYRLPGGPLMRDQKCPTGRYNPISASVASEKIAAHPPAADDTALRDAAKGAMEGGESSPSELETSGPASQLGTPSSSTTTNGQGTTTTTQQPRYEYKYEGDKITYTTTNITNTCAGAGSCSDTNAVSTTTQTEAPATEQDPKDPCTANPTRAGCAQLGTAPEQQGINQIERNVSVTPEGGFGADNGTCPAPIELSSGTTVDPFALVCSYMGGIRFAVLGFAWLMATLIFLGRVD